MIRELEELSLDAWPALRQIVYDGWVLRLADGYTRRANSVNPLYEGALQLEEKVGFCERFYASAGLPTVFKLTAAARPAALDSQLRRLGYREEARTSVRRLPIGSPRCQAGISESSTPDERWVESFVQLSMLPPRRKETLRAMLGLIIAPAWFVLIEEGRQPVACAMGVLQGMHMGLFDIVTRADQRRRGLGQRMVEHLLARGSQHGASSAYLQVMLGNEPAMRLYDKLGFIETYQYWYQVKI